MSFGSYLVGVLLGLDVLANSILGGKRYQTISCRIGESIDDGGWASRIPWPKWWIEHCNRSIYSTTV